MEDDLMASLWASAEEAAGKALQAQIATMKAAWASAEEAAGKALQAQIATMKAAWASRAALECCVEIDPALAQRAQALHAAFVRRMREIFSRADEVGRRGWTITGTMTPPDVAALSEMNGVAEADAYMVAWYERADPDLLGTEKHLLAVDVLVPYHVALAQCFRAFRRGDYAVAIPCLASAFERSIRAFEPPEKLYNAVPKNVVGSLYAKTKAKNGEAISLAYPMSLSSFVGWLYQNYGITDASERRVFRHGIQHGTQPPPNEKAEVLRLLHALNTVSELHCRSLGKRPVKRRAAHVQKVGHVLAGFAFVDQLPGVVDLLRRQFHLPAKLHASALRGLHSGAGAF